MKFTDINIDTIEGVLLCRAIGALMRCPDHSTKTPSGMVKFLEDMSSEEDDNDNPEGGKQDE